MRAIYISPKETYIAAGDVIFSHSLKSFIFIWGKKECLYFQHGDSNLDVTSLSRSDSASSTQSMQHGGMPELLIGLAYNGTTGRLCVEVIKGSNFRNMAMNRAPGTPTITI